MTAPSVRAPDCRTGALRLRAFRFLVRTWAMAAKETLHIYRDPRTLYVALGMPVILLLIFGYGVGFDIDRLSLAVADADRTVASSKLVRALTESGEFREAPRLTTPDDALGMFRRGQASAALVVPRGYEETLARGGVAKVQLLVDGADAIVANQVLAKADAIVRTHARSLLSERLREMQPPVQVTVWTLYNPTNASAIFMVPGLAAYLVAISAVLLTALTVAAEWENGSMEQLFASPVGRLEIILGKLLPYLALGLIELLLVLAFGATAFDVPMRGSPIAVLLVGLGFLVGMLGQGLFISVVARNQLVATQAGALSALLPSMLFSGMLFPLENMPTVLQWLSYAVPARYLVHALRGALLKGNGLDILWPDLVAQLVFCVVILTLATTRFPRRLA